MNTTIEVTKKVTTLINILTVEPENQQKLIDTVRYRNRSPRLVLYIYTLWADSLESSDACNGHVNRCLRPRKGNAADPSIFTRRASGRVNCLSVLIRTTC